MIEQKPLIFQPADILLPAGDLRRWSVVACDQFTSDSEYWAEVEHFVGDAPSTLRLMLPEYYLGRCDEQEETERIQQTMRRYLSQDVFRTLPDSMVFVQRRLSSGVVREGLVGVIDLEAYDYADDSHAPIRASEHTVEDRLPPRVRVRREAALELPHVMLFFNDSENVLMRRAAALAGDLLYDFDLMGGGGHICGRQISGDNARVLSWMISDGAGMRLAVGDGNHSLAAARKCWLERKEHLSPEQIAADPARYALAELVNIHDDAITFEPIHRVLFHTDAADWISEAQTALFDPDGRPITLLAEGKIVPLTAKGRSIGELIDRVEQFCRAYCNRHGGEIDYIHGDDETVSLASGAGCCGVLLPQMKKEELFTSVEHTGPFPKKSFSVGLGSDKRYYLECRKIQS